MPISRVPHAQFQKALGYTVTTGAGRYVLPPEDVDALYGPGWPVQPVTRPEDSEVPRVLDYPVGINFTLQPRIGYEGLMPVKALKAAYTNLPEVSAPVNMIIRELCGFMPMLKNIKTDQKEKDGHPYDWMTGSPDRKNPFNVWITRFKKSAKIYAAPAFYMRRQGTAVTAMEYIDGSTFFLIVNSRGDLPEPFEFDSSILDYVGRLKYAMNSNDPTRVMATLPTIAKDYIEKQRKRVAEGKPFVTTTPAFTQIIQGIPFSFWDKDQVYFIPEPPASTMDSPYGETYIERSWTWINLIAVMTAFELGHYRTGNTPEGIMTLPKDMFPSMVKLAAGEREWNARMADSSQVQAARNRWLPEGTRWFPTKKPDFPRDLYQNAKENILAAIGMPLSETGEKPNSGLGGKGFEEGAHKDLARQLLEVEKESLEDAFNYVLKKDGVDDVKFYMDYPQEEIDPARQQEDMWNKFTHGLWTLNDCLSAMGRQAIGNPEDKNNTANMHMLMAGNSIYVMEHLNIDPNGLVAPNTGGNAFGGSPTQPEDGVVDEKDKGKPADKKMVQEVVKKIEDSQGRYVESNTTYSIPPAKGGYVKGPIVPMESVGFLLSHLTTEKLLGAMNKAAPTMGGLLVRAKDTGRFLMIQRSFNDEADPAKGVWEFPGGHVEASESPLDSAKREWSEETGLKLPIGEVVAEWKTPDGVYCGYVYLIESEDLADIFGTRDGKINPDDPDGDDTEAIAWFEFWQLRNNPVIRRELALDITSVEDALKSCDALLKVSGPHSLSWLSAKYSKHCGVCDGDEDFFGAPVTRMGDNKVMMRQEEGEQESQPAIWKPADGTGQHVREEAAYLLDQSLSFGLVPVAYVTETQDGEEGVAIWDNSKIMDNTWERTGSTWSPDWEERLVIFANITGSNPDYFGKHPDHEGRIVLIGNSRSFPEEVVTRLPTVHTISSANLAAITDMLNDESTWKDIIELVGPTAAEQAKHRARSLLITGNPTQ